MVPLIIVYLHSGRQLLLRGVGEGGHFWGPSAGLRAPFFWASPSTSTSVLEGSSTASARRSALRAGPRGGGLSPASDVGRLSPSTAIRRYVPVVAQRALGPHTDAGSASRQTPKSLPRSHCTIPPAPGTLSVLPLESECTGWRRVRIPGAPGCSPPQEGASGPPTSRRTRSRTCSSSPERCPKGVSVDTTPVAQATHLAWIKGDGRCTGPRPGG